MVNLSSRNSQRKETLESMETLETYFQKADNHRHQKQWNEAIKCYQTVLEMKPEDWQARHSLGDCLIGLKRWQEAAEEYCQALAINPQCSWAYHNLGLVLVNLEQFDEAYKCFVKIEEQEPDFWDSQPANFQIQQRLGDYLLEKQRWEDVVTVSRRVIRLNPDFEWGHVNLKRALEELGKSEDTFKVLEKSVEIEASFGKHDSLGEVSNDLAPGESEAQICEDQEAQDHKPNLDSVFTQLDRETEISEIEKKDWLSKMRWLFDSDYYLEQKPDLADLEIDPWSYYLQKGWKLDINPHRFFDIKFYRSQISNQSVDPLYHYFALGGFAKFSPHPAFDLEYYCQQVPHFDPTKEAAVLHFLNTPQEKRPKTNPVFDLPYYLKNNEDIQKYQLCPNLHFVQHGYRETHRKINESFSSKYVYNLFPHYSFRHQSAQQFYLSQRVYRRKRVLLVGHQASRTGAPLILLRLMQDISQLSDVEVFLILAEGGNILDDYQACGHVYVVKNQDSGFLDSGKHTPEFVQELQYFLSIFENNPPDFAICNTAEVRHIGDVINSMGIPVFSLIHEMADPYDTHQWKAIYDQSNKVIFPSQFVENRANKKFPLPKNKSIVLGQGLLRDNFGKYSHRQSRSKVIEELDLAEDTFIVLGCGTMDFRKGIDFFVRAVRKVINSLRAKGEQRPIKFIWVGLKIPGFNFSTNPSYWSLMEIKKEGLEEAFIHVPETEDVEKYFLAADLFLLTSRSDPFPCVVHEAMAASLPVIYFQDSGGAAELVKKEAGIPVTYGDVAEMADAVVSLYCNPQHCQELGQAGKQIIRTQYQFRSYTQKIIKMICAELSLPFSDFYHSSTSKEKQKRKVYVLNPDWGISGVNTFTRHLVKNLNKFGYDAKVLFTNGRFSYLPEKKSAQPDIPCIFLQQDVDYLDYKNVWFKLINFFKHHEPCIVIPNYDYVASAISPLLPNQIGIVGIAHSDDLEHYEHTYRLGLWWNRIVTVSDFIREKIIEQNRSFEEKISTIRYGVPVEQVLSPQDLQNKIKTTDSCLKIVYSGRFVHNQKRIERYVELTKIMVAEGIKFHLTMLGDGDKYDWVRGELNSFVEEGIVDLPGRVNSSEVNAALAQADVFLLLSDFEGLPLSLLEAMTHGCIPVVTEMKSGIPEVIKHGENGFIYPKSNLQAFAKALGMLANNPEKRLAISQKVFDSVAKYKLRDTDMAAAYIEVFEQVFTEIENETYSRPPSFGYKSSLKGTMPPVWLT